MIPEDAIEQNQNVTRRRDNFIPYLYIVPMTHGIIRNKTVYIRIIGAVNCYDLKLEKKVV